MIFLPVSVKIPRYFILKIRKNTDACGVQKKLL